MEKITTELLIAIYNRASQYALTKYGTVPDDIKIDEDGNIIAEWHDYHCGEHSTESEYISADNLTEDLDIVAAQRKERLEKERIANEIRQKEINRRYEEQQKERRKQEYLKLKREFEQ